MKRLWIVVSGYDDAAGLARACGSVRAIWPDADRFPIIYADGAYAKFPHESPSSPAEVLDVANRFATFVVPWPVAAPTEFLKRTSYFAGLAGDYALVVDTDETVTGGVNPDRLTEAHHLIPLRGAKGGAEGFVMRLFRVESGLHHWGCHELAYAGKVALRRSLATLCSSLAIVHHGCADRGRQKKKRAYYGVGIREDESEFRQKIGA